MRPLFVFAMILALSGFLSMPQPADARGELVKGSFPAVYYVAADGQRYVFPNERIYRSWYPDFSTVQTIPDAQLAQYAIGGNITYRSGTRLVKLATDPNVYAVEAGGILHWVKTEAFALALYGDAWAQRVDDLSDAFFPAYKIGSPLETARYPDGTLLKDASNGVYYIVWGGMRRQLANAALTQNGYQAADAIEADLTAYPVGAAIAGEDTTFSDTAELSTASRQDMDVVAESAGGLASVFADATGQALGDFVFSLRAPTEIRSLAFDIRAETNGTSDADPGGLVRGDGTRNIEPAFSNLYIVDERGTRLFPTASLIVDAPLDGLQRISFTGSLTLPPGRHHLRLLADTPVQATLQERYLATMRLDASSFLVRGVATTNVSPASLAGLNVTMEEFALSVESYSGAKSVFAVSGQTGPYDAMGFHISNPTSGPLTIRKFVITGFVDEGEGSADFTAGADEDDGAVTSLRDIVSSLSLVKADGTVLATTSTFGGDGTVRFENVAWTIPAADALDVLVRVTLNPAAPYGLGADRIAFDLLDPDEDIEVRDAANQEIDVTGATPNGGAGPRIILSVSEGGALEITGASIGPARFLMGQETAAYGLRFEADEAEDIVIDSIGVRITDSVANRSVNGARLVFQQADGTPRSIPAGALSGGTFTFRSVGLVVPKDHHLDATVYAQVASSSGGAVSGDDIGFTFEPAVFTAHGATSARAYDSEDVGKLVTLTLDAGSTSPVRKNIPFLTRTSDQPLSGEEDPVSPMLRFRVLSQGEGTSKLTKLTFKIEASDAGTRLNNQDADNDLLEYLAEVNGDLQDDNDIVELEDLTSNDTIGEGSNGDIHYAVYDSVTRVIDTTPSGRISQGGDFGLITYTFPNGLSTNTAEHVYEFRLDTRGLAAGHPSVKVTLLGGSDFGWSDGTFDGSTETGNGISNLPVAGLELGF